LTLGTGVQPGRHAGSALGVLPGTDGFHVRPAGLIGIKLRSGATNLLRAQDLADVIGLIRHHRLTAEFARHLDKSLRPTFRKLVRTIHRQRSGP
jgi:hypothetical protein